MTVSQQIVTIAIIVLGTELTRFCHFSSFRRENRHRNTFSISERYRQRRYLA